MEEQNNETVNDQQPEQLTGLVNNQAQTVNDIVSEAVNQPTTEEKERERLRQILQDTRIRSDTDVPKEEYALEVDGKANVSLFTMGGMYMDLKEILGREVDLVEEDTLLPFAVDSANSDKKLIYERTS